MNSKNDWARAIQPLQALADLFLFLSAMMVVRLVHFESLGFWGNGMFRSITVVAVATALLYYRKQSWKTLGLVKPEKWLKTLAVAAAILIGTVASIMVFEIFFREMLFGPEEVGGSGSRFSELKDNYPYFFSIIGVVWVESFLEELQDRGFSLNRFESLFAKVPLATILAVLIQAAIFGFRHSYDFSPRSVTTGLIGLVFGAVYVLSGRNLWPLIMAHIFLNTMSMLERV